MIADQMLEMRRFESSKLKGWLNARRLGKIAAANPEGVTGG
jgi:hypothetical protein